MDTEKESTFRILSQRDGRVQPMFDAAPIGPLSPSSSLLVERRDLEPISWQSHLLEDQLFHFFMKPAMIGFSLKDGVIARIPVAHGQAVFCPRKEWHNIRWDEGISVLSIRIPDSAFMEAARERLRDGSLEIVPRHVVADDRLTHLLFALDAERARGYSAGRLFVDCIETALANLLITSFNVFAPRSIPRKGGMAPRVLRRVIEFMHANLDKQIGLKELADCAGLSLSHFSFQFRASTNQSPHQYILQLRIERSKELLTDSRLSVLDVGLEVGFRNQQHFATVFRNSVGVPPSVYRTQL
ncbi:MAG TPA: AraC family transcriptional regulator [Terracidiphilus sp.]|jgi:AraC family transcriptional regulator